MSDDRTKDLEAFKAELVQIKIDCVDAQLQIARMNDGELKSCGFKSHTDGYNYKLIMAQAKMRDAEKAFLKKWPD